MKKKQLSILSSEQFGQILEGMKESFIQVDNDLNYVHVNKNGEKLLKKKAKDVLGKNMLEVFPEANKSIVFKKSMEAIKKKKPIIFQHHSKDFSTWWEVRIYPTPIGVSFYFLDITKRKMAEEQLELQANILHNVWDSVIVTDLSGKIIFWNQGASRIFGYSENEMIGKTPAVLYPHMNTLSSDLEKIYQGKDYSGEWEGKKKDGTPIWIDIKTTRLYSSDKKVVGYIGIARDITDVKKALSDLQINQERLELANSAASIGTYEIDLKANTIFLSPTEEKLLNVSKTVTRDLKLWEKCIHEDDWEKIQKEMKIIYKNRVKDYETEFRVKISQGNYRWLLGKSHIYYDAKGKPKKIIGVNMDISPRKQINDTQYRLAAIVESTDDAIIGKDLDGRVTSWNKGAEKIYGYTDPEIIGKHISLLTPFGKKDEINEIMGKIKRGKSIDKYESKRVKKDGRIIDVSLTISPIRDSNGKIIGASTIARDVTERKKLIQNLEFLSKATKVFSSSLDYQTTLNSVVKMAVPDIADWCAIDFVTEENTLKTVAIAHKDPKKIKWAKELRKSRPVNLSSNQGLAYVINSGNSMLIPFISDQMLKETAKDEKDYELIKSIGLTSAIMVPIKVQSKIIGALQFVTTESRKRFDKDDLTMAEELATRASLAIENAQHFENAQKAIHVRDEFISIASHELKTPITSLKVYVQALKKKIEKGEPLVDVGTYFEKMDTQVTKLSKLVNDLLSASRLQTGKLQFEKQHFDMNILVKEVVESVQPLSKKHKIVVSGSIRKEVFGDKDRIGQVVINLINNAIRYSPNADKILIQLLQNSHKIIIEIKDFGIGIDKKDQEKIFERFYQVDDQDEKTFPGLGIGLYISREIARSHGGDISVKSEKGKGSSFSFSLPITEN